MKEKTKLENLRLYLTSDEWRRIKAYCETKFNEYTATIDNDKRAYVILEYTEHDRKDDKIECYQDILNMMLDEQSALAREDLENDIAVLKPHKYEIFDQYGRSMDTNIYSHIDMIRMRRTYYYNLGQLVDIVIETKMPNREKDITVMNPLDEKFTNSDTDSVLPEDIIQSLTELQS